MLGDLNIPVSSVHRALFEAATEGLVVVNKLGTIVLANPRTTELFGFAEDEILGKPVEILLPLKLRDSHQKFRDGYFKRPCQRSMGDDFTLSGRCKDGSEFPVEVSLNHFKIEGEILVMALVTDVTARKQAEAELARLNAELEERVRRRTSQLRDSERLYSLIARNFPNGSINVFDREFNYILVEGKELYKLGVTSEMLTGTNYLAQLDSEIRDYIREHLEPVFEGKNSGFEVSYKNNTYEINATGLPDEDGSINQILVVEHNISRQKQAEARIYAALEKERELNELKSRFVSMASHEFRTPLSTILSSASLLTRYTQPEHEEKKTKHITRIQSSVRNLVGILEDFLSLDKLEAGKIVCQPTELYLSDLIEEVVGDMELILKKEQRIEVNNSATDLVQLDPKLLRNILINLISNAAKYSSEGSVVWINSYIKADFIFIKVRDQGIGIPKDEQVYLFDRFFRAGNVTNIQGTGLGLNIVQKYLGLMQGEITYKSEESVGSEFTVKLPVILKNEEDPFDRR